MSDPLSICTNDVLQERVPELLTHLDQVTRRPVCRHWLQRVSPSQLRFSYEVVTMTCELLSIPKVRGPRSASVIDTVNPKMQ